MKKFTAINLERFTLRLSLGAIKLIGRITKLAIRCYLETYPCFIRLKFKGSG